MSSILTEADKSFRYTDIKDISFIPTEDKAGEITAQISRETPPYEIINLGVPEKAHGRLNRLSVRNGVQWLTRFGIGGFAIYDGAMRFVNSDGNLGLAIAGACEAISGTAMAIYSYRNSLRRENYLYSTRELLGKQVRTEMLKSLGIKLPTPLKR